MRVTREVCLLGVTGVYHSAAAAVSRSLKVSRGRVGISRQQLEAADQCHVVVTTRSGRVRIGRLSLTERHVELHQVIRGIPCRHRYDFNDIIACYISSGKDDPESDPSAHSSGWQQAGISQSEPSS